MWRLSAFCNDKKNKYMADGKKNTCGLFFTDEWDKMIEKDVSPKEIWETRYDEVNKINSDFSRKFEWKSESGPKDSMTPSLSAAIEQVLLVFGKSYVQDMQSRWEKSQDFGGNPAEFWREERSKFEKKHWWWRWGKKSSKNSGRRKENDESAMFSEFDEEILKD
ncbi:uncharacterized protein LOC125681921 [Ostrea edulis]|uniref:uncharacterized protein LOC125681921 n=1 Tax=Ostrea edulis TaxID=37623 RepID=UPI0024AFEB3B|nr:uncharacterized protein LOC125681921 [Ostrea edulis]